MSPVLTAARFHSNSQLKSEKLYISLPPSLSDICGHPEQLWGWLGMGQCATKTDSANTNSPTGKLARSRSFTVSSLHPPHTSVMDGDCPEDYYSDDFDEDDDPIECSSDNDDVYMESNEASPSYQGSLAMEEMSSYTYRENDSFRWLKL